MLCDEESGAGGCLTLGVRNNCGRQATGPFLLVLADATESHINKEGLGEMHIPSTLCLVPKTLV